MQVTQKQYVRWTQQDTPNRARMGGMAVAQYGGKRDDCPYPDGELRDVWLAAFDERKTLSR